MTATQRSTRAADPTPGRLRPLREVLAYKNPKILWRFQEKLNISTKDARDLFRETLRWMWVSARSRELGGPSLAIRHSMLLLDEMWHEFILFTCDYTEFCNTYLGGYLHHQPATRSEKIAYRRQRARDPARLRQQEEAALVEQFSFLRDHIGERALEKWIRTYKAKYTRAFMNEHRLPY